MSKVMVIYDNRGSLYLQSEFYNLPDGGLNYLEVDVPEGQIISGVDTSTSPNIAKFSSIPKTDLEKAKEEIAALKEQVAQTEYALMMGGLI